MVMLPTSSRSSRTRAALGLDDPRLGGILSLLWAATTVFVLLHLTRRFFGIPESAFFDLATERGYGEIFFQTLTGWSAMLLVLIAVRHRAWIMLIWAAFALYLLIDDYFTLHERIGTWFEANLMDVGPLSNQIGEALWLLGIGVLLVLAVAIAYRFSSVDTRRATRIVATLFGLLAFFGVAVDLLHSVFGDLRFADALFIAVEDGGEIAVMSVLVTYLVSHAFPRVEAGPVTADEAEPVALSR